MVGAVDCGLLGIIAGQSDDSAERVIHGRPQIEVCRNNGWGCVTGNPTSPPQRTHCSFTG